METTDRRASRPRRIVVLVSGNGSNLQALLDATSSGTIFGDVVAVVANRHDAFALRRAADAGVPAIHVAARPDEPREGYDARLADLVAGFEPDLVVLAGWMRVLTTSFLGWFPEQVINLHPALPGELPGTNAIERAWTDAVRGDRTTTGAMVHLVPDGGVDDGPVLATVVVPIDTTGDFEQFASTMHDAEHRLLVDTVANLCAPPGAGAPSPTHDKEILV
jgi:phosphoribosylglycinamide formyltransferase-1